MSGFRPRAPRPRSRTASDRAHLLVLLGIALLSFLQRPGKTTFDTKFDLTADPGAFLSRTLHLWNPELNFGELQNQAYGYLFPQGTFFLLGDKLGVPEWIVQRLWSALILLAAYEGARRLMRALRPAAPDVADADAGWIPVLAGLAYALSPRLLGLSGVLSAEILPTAVLPWVVLPLVLALRGRLSPRSGALLSGVAVLFMGGVNAVEDLAALPLPALLVLGALGSGVGRRLAGWWVLAVGLACAWWMLPLLVLGKYSPPFLDYIETSTATTHPLGWVNTARGADHWLAFINVGGEPWWPGAHDLATEPHLIAITAIVAALGLAGLFHPSMPARRPLATSALLGLFLLTIAHVAPYASPLSGTMRELLDGALAPLRNVHKVDPLVRLPMALGLAQLAAVATARARASAWRSWVRRLVPPLTIAVLLGLLLASAQPLFDRTLRKPGWDAVPDSWSAATDYLAAHADGRRALVLPGSGFGQQTWGWTIDEPIQGLARSPWVTRSQVPLVPGATIRFLDSVEERVTDGRGSPVLADVLARSGVGYVVVRRDLDLLASSAPAPARVDQAIAASPGLEQVARFGSTGFGDEAAISVYAVRRDVPRVEAVPTDELENLVGGPEDVFTMVEAGALPADRPVLLDPDTPADLVGDGYRLRERQFGRLRDSLSQIMTAQEKYRTDRRAHDYPGVSGMARVRAVYPQISALSASSSSGYADTLGAVRPELGPYSAVDGITGTYWRSAPLESPRGQWLQIRLKQPQPLSHVDLALGVDGYSGVPIRRIRVQAGDQVSDQDVDPSSGTVRVPLDGRPVSRIRVTVLSTLGNPEFGVVAIREITLPGLALGRSLQVPDGEAGPDTRFVFRAQPERRACVQSALGVVCDADDYRPSEEQAGLERTFRTSGAGTWSISGTVVARSAPDTAQLLWPLGNQVRVGASSVLADDPSVSGQFAFDGNPATPWLSARGDAAPALVLQWGKPRTISRLQVLPTTAPARAPSRAIIEAGDETREVDLTSGSLGFFEPLRTDRITVRFPMSDGTFDDEATARARALPVGVGDLVIGGLNALTYGPNPSASTGARCGLGPDVVVDGTRLRTRVVGSIAAVLSGEQMKLVPCGGGVRLGAGEHTLSVPSGDRFVPAEIALTPREPATTSPVPSAASSAQRSTRILRWESTDRRVRIGAGPSALLRIPENLNAGWRATLNGRTLEQTAIDGWQQAYRVPAGAGGVVYLVYTPDGPYRLMLLLGGIFGLVLVLAAVLVLIRDRRREPQSLELPDALGAGMGAGPLGIAGLIAAGLLGGLWPLLGAGAGVALRRRPAVQRTVAVLLIALAGVAAAVVAAVDARTSTDVVDAVTGFGVGMLIPVVLVATALRRKKEN